MELCMKIATQHMNERYVKVVAAGGADENVKARANRSLLSRDNTLGQMHAAPAPHNF